MEEVDGEKKEDLLKVRIATLKSLIGKLKEGNNQGEAIKKVLWQKKKIPSKQTLKLPTNSSTVHILASYKYKKNISTSKPKAGGSEKVASFRQCKWSKVNNNGKSNGKKEERRNDSKNINNKSLMENCNNEKIVSKFKVGKRTPGLDPRNMSHIKNVPSKMKWIKSVGNTTSSNKVVKSRTVSYPNTAVSILSKYKVVHKNVLNNKKNVPNNKSRINKSNNRYVWRNRRNSLLNSSSKMKFNLQKQNLDSKLINKSFFVRRRYNLIRRTKPSQASSKRVPLLSFNQFYHSHRINSFHPSTNSTFLYRRLNYINSRKPVITNTKSGHSLDYSHNSTSPNKAIILTRHGSNYRLAGNLKSLTRLNSQTEKSSKTRSNRITKYKLTRSNSKDVKQMSVKQILASQVLKKSITKAQRKKVNKTKFCLFFNRFGKCKRGSNCNYIHDEEKVAVCTRFLRGTCKDEKCLFSHKIDPSKYVNGAWTFLPSR